VYVNVPRERKQKSWVIKERGLGEDREKDRYLRERRE
jgi:hypothetical protein